MKITTTNDVQKNQHVYIVKEKDCDGWKVIWCGPLMAEYLGKTKEGNVHFRYAGRFLVFPIIADNEAIDFCNQGEDFCNQGERFKYHVFDSMDAANSFILRFYDMNREVS